MEGPPNDEQAAQHNETTTQAQRNEYSLPVSPLITRNLSYVLNPANLPHLPVKFVQHDCLLGSVPFDSPEMKLRVRSADALEADIRAAVPIGSRQWHDTVQLMQALALVVASPASEIDPRSLAKDRLLLASCYAALNQLTKARSVLEVANDDARKKPHERGVRDDTSLVLLALSNVTALQRNQDEASNRFLRWYAKSLRAAERVRNDTGCN